MPNGPTVSVIIPAYNAEPTLSATLRALAQAEPPPHEVIVVDDGSSDGTRRCAESLGARVIQLEANRGAAAAKNRGARTATGDALFFTDADIVPPPQVIGVLQKALRAPATDGVVGILSIENAAGDWASQFKNLWMNFTYIRFERADRIGLFYTSAAAMRRTVFERLGGFDENYRGPSIAEDTEFGQRAWSKGYRILLKPELKVVHLKTYTLSRVLAEDLKRARALVMMRLRKWGQPFFTSVPLLFQLAVPELYATILLTALALVLAPSWAPPILVAGGILFYLLNANLLWFLLRRRGIAFLLRSALFLPLDVLVVGAGMLKGVLDFARGQRY